VKEGTVKGKNIIPDHTLALAIEADKSAYPAVDISYEQAISYLRHEAITLPENTPKGIVLLTYHGHELGFAKNLGNRANNLYPQEWRIKSSHIPDNPKILISNIKTNEL
jgi:NOL1/NOP2/sun family protein